MTNMTRREALVLAGTAALPLLVPTPANAADQPKLTKGTELRSFVLGSLLVKEYRVKGDKGDHFEADFGRQITGPVVASVSGFGFAPFGAGPKDVHSISVSAEAVKTMPKEGKALIRFRAELEGTYKLNGGLTIMLMAQSDNG